MKVSSVAEAWKIAGKLFPTDYVKDEQFSKLAGFDVYSSPVNGINDWICDLGTRLEVNLKNGAETVDIWIENEPNDKMANLEKCIRNQIEKKAVSELETTFECGCDVGYECALRWVLKQIEKV